MIGEPGADNPRPLMIQTMDLTPGKERALLQKVLSERLDLIHIRISTPESIRKLDQLGLPCHVLAPCQLWHKSRTFAAPSAAPIEVDAHWDARTPAWNGSAMDAIVSLMREPNLTQDNFSEGALYFQDKGSTASAYIRQEAGTRHGEVCTAPVNQAQAMMIVSEASKCLDSILVPFDQQDVNIHLAGAGFDHVQTGQGLLLAPLLTRSQVTPFKSIFRLSSEEVARYGEESGDLNPLHFDDAFARLHGFDGRICHGMLFNAWVTKYLGMEYPGPGTIFLKQASSYFSPIYPDQDYEATVTVPILDSNRGIMRVLVQLRDGNDEIVLLSYNDVMHRQAKS